ncbi:uncharacterized protein LOC110036548 [Phalaenopsis equestris]|uniref:uncharacterized protein LOC110036548 n=1 Tax=Phalaenopsis equestris TaxID=78828 RepID=UPI0009E59ED7|nr:uncharacterized protein LOC110036548 [Phalaenopsis equestris]
MAWRRLYWDLVFVPLGIVVSTVYHCWLLVMVKKWPQRTTIGVGNSGQIMWVAAMLKENDKKNVLAVQSLRNNIMGSSLVASSSFLICCGLLAFTSTISDKRELVLTNLNQVEVSHKSAVLILAFMAVFFCQTLSITFLAQLSLAINTLILPETKVTPEQLLTMLTKGILLNTIANRLFFTAMPLVLWIYSPVLVFASTCGVIAVLYMTDIVPRRKVVTYENDENNRDVVVAP